MTTASRGAAQRREGTKIDALLRDTRQRHDRQRRSLVEHHNPQWDAWGKLLAWQLGWENEGLRYRDGNNAETLVYDPQSGAILNPKGQSNGRDY